ncbi:hypothetical protein [Actinoplanes auranticolor]|uniref:Uncharacterized protein n=1 Tax=Actinoplanes auranticolor TaxID=47988 RepID=A0A919S8I6_9ACTN|nr:hypothetical protein [Actinoplanes auranticolor]GIM66706.1 hypothetical protein Aau02nite_24080 [Actinoplanes auranticolor]
MVSDLVTSSTAADPRLLRAYRRLLRAYPPGPRRDELLDTLVESAPPGRRRPRLREMVNLLWHGSRARLGRPKSRGIVVLTLLVAVAGGCLGAGVANWVGWHAVEPLPTGAEAAEISETVFPGLTVWGGGEAARVVSQSDGEGIEYGYAVSWVKHTAATRDVAAYTAGVRARLEAAGWTVTGVDPPLDQTNVVDADPADRSESFTATRGRLGLRFNDYYWAGRPAYDGDGNATYYLWQEPPSWLLTVTWLGFLPGAFLAWLLTGWASRRLEPNPGITAPVAVGAVLAVLCVVPATLLALSSDGRADETAAPSWQGLAFSLRTPAVLFGLLAALLLFLAAVQRPPRRLPQWQRQATRGLDLARRRPVAAVALAAVTSLLTGLGLYALVTQQLLPGSCTPAVPSGIVDPPSARTSDKARVFIDRQATEDQRNLAQAAIWRGMGGSPEFAGDPRAPGFLSAYCSHGRVDSEVAERLPSHWSVELTSPGLFRGLAAEMMAMPGVVAVQHVPD